MKHVVNLSRTKPAPAAMINPIPDASWPTMLIGNLLTNGQKYPTGPAGVNDPKNTTT
jgi:hypothetical protein